VFMGRFRSFAMAYAVLPSSANNSIFTRSLKDRCFEHEVLYVFCPQIMLLNFHGIEETVDLYTKFNLIESENGQRVVVISFHKRNKQIDYCFR